MMMMTMMTLMRKFVYSYLGSFKKLKLFVLKQASQVSWNSWENMIFLGWPDVLEFKACPENEIQNFFILSWKM